jgi:hypothetical protein
MTGWLRLIDYWDREWKGKSFNGLCEREELRARSAAQAADAHTVEGYTVWGVALHLHRYKEIFLARLEGRDPRFPAGDEDFPALPADGLTDGR